MSHDEPLLVGVLAHRHGFLTAEQVLQALAAWANDADRPNFLGWLEQRGWLNRQQEQALGAAVNDEAARHRAAGWEQSVGVLEAVPPPDPVGSSPGTTEQPALPTPPSAPAPAESYDGRGAGHGSAISSPTPALAPDTDLEATAPVTPARDTPGPAPEGGGRNAGARFTVLCPHARGGLGQVSLARDEELNREVALKEILANQDSPVSRQRFLAEARITGQLEHPGVVPVYALGRGADGRPYYAMRFVRGRTLSEAVGAYHRQPTPLALRELLRRFQDVCQAIAYAHSKGVLHRDLKPGNIMLGDYGETLVLDWGLAKRLAGGEAGADARSAEAAPAGGVGGVTLAGQVLGTPAFMAPEQAAGQSESVGPAADIYSLGGSCTPC
jgi:hypothetical protein